MRADKCNAVSIVEAFDRSHNCTADAALRILSYLSYLSYFSNTRPRIAVRPNYVWAVLAVEPPACHDGADGFVGSPNGYLGAES